AAGRTAGGHSGVLRSRVVDRAAESGPRRAFEWGLAVRSPGRRRTGRARLRRRSVRDRPSRAPGRQVAGAVSLNRMVRHFVITPTYRFGQALTFVASNDSGYAEEELALPATG